jgi:hypothetical protein
MLRKDKSQHAKTVGISLYPELIAVIDEHRGLVPRSNFITYLLQQSPVLFAENKESKTVAVLTRLSHQSQSQQKEADPNVNKE